MEKKNYLILDDEFIQYCKLNNITDIEKVAKETFVRGFTILKYGEKPQVESSNKEKFFPNPDQTINEPIIPLDTKVNKQTEKKDKKDLYEE